MITEKTRKKRETNLKIECVHYFLFIISQISKRMMFIYLIMIHFSRYILRLIVYKECSTNMLQSADSLRAYNFVEKSLRNLERKSLQVKFRYLISGGS